MKITLESGVSQTLSLVGYNFMFKGGSGDIRVKMMNNNSAVIEESELEVGEQLINGSERFEKVTIFNLHDETQTIDFEVGSFKRENTREGSSVSVVSVPDIDIATMPPVVVSSTPDNPQKYFGHENCILDNCHVIGLKTFVSPATNTNGLIIYIACLIDTTNSSSVSLLLNTSAPVNENDGTAIAYAVTSTIVRTATCNVAMPLFVPSGYGVYGVSVGEFQASVMYEVL